MNKTYSWIKIIAISATVAASLTGCKTGYSPLTNSSVSSNSAKTEALKQDEGYQSEVPQYDEKSRFINSLKPHINQIYYFDFNQSNINNSEYISSLKIQADYLSKHPESKVRLEGRADGRGSREYNIALGWRRVQTVAKYLKMYGVSPNQIKMVSYGKENPDPAGNTPEIWRLNRRVNLNYEAR